MTTTQSTNIISNQYKNLIWCHSFHSAITIIVQINPQYSELMVCPALLHSSLSSSVRKNSVHAHSLLQQCHKIWPSTEEHCRSLKYVLRTLYIHVRKLFTTHLYTGLTSTHPQLGNNELLASISLNPINNKQYTKGGLSLRGREASPCPFPQIYKKQVDEFLICSHLV